jgi:hypothetical protein
MVREASAVVLQSGVLQIVVVIKRGFSSHPLGGTVELIRQVKKRERVLMWMMAWYN